VYRIFISSAKNIDGDADVRNIPRDNKFKIDILSQKLSVIFNPGKF